jgi:Zn-dependent peptidase ImmA (M78 family)
MALARALDTTPADLIRAAPPLPPARFRSAKRLKEREQLLIRVARELGAYAQLEQVVPDQTARFDADAYDPGAGSPIERASIAAAKVRQAFGLTDGEPVRDICGLLEGNGIKVLRLPIATEGFFGLSVIDHPWGPAVAVNVWDRITVERWIFTAAHELGHLVLHHADFDANCSDEVPENEKEADLFAACFLMPKQAFLDEWEEASGLPLFDRVLKVKRVFRVSYRTVLHRLGELGYPNVWPRFVAQAQRQTGRRLLRTDEPAPMDAAEFQAGVGAAPARREPDQLTGSDFVVDRRQRLVRNAFQGELISMGRAAEILGLSLAEMRQLAASWA